MSELSEKAKAFSVDAILGVLEKPAMNKKDHKHETHKENILSINTGLEYKHEINVELCCKELWNRFYIHGTEMIITKAGRRMFPTLKVRLSGLIENVNYLVFMDIIPVDNKRYRYIYNSSQWIPAGSGDATNSRIYIQPDSPATGRLWASRGGIVSFDKLKLTNNKNPVINGQISLQSMHKYIPRVHVIPNWSEEYCRGIEPHLQNSIKFTFPETLFITVTAYQNHQITKLKIASNPFAKGFRETSRNMNK